MAKSYQLSYYPETCEVEMYDIKNRRMFLKRCKYEDLQADQLYLGSTITVYGRQLKLVDYGDDFTRNSLASNSERTIAVVPPAGMPHLGKITNAIVRSRFIISEMRMVQLSKAEAEEFAGGDAGLAQSLVSGASSVLEIMGNNAIGSWLNLLGPSSNPKSLEAVFGVRCYGSADTAAAARDRAFFFAAEGRNTGRVSSVGDRPTSLCLVKPHAMAAGYAGLVLDQVMGKFHVTALEMFNLDRANATEFYEVYKGVTPEYNAMVEELISSPFLAIEVADPDGGNPVEGLRALCGPADPEIARVLRGGSLRAQFGQDKVKNGVHCTDLPEDGSLECEFFFSILCS